MKSYSIDTPTVLLSLGDGNWHVNYNISEETMPVGMLGDEQEEPRTQFVYETVFIEGKATKPKIRAAMKSNGAEKQTIDSVINEIYAK